MSVDHGAYLQIAQLCEALATVFELTVVGFHLLMYHKVRPHVAGLREAPVAKAALKGSLTGVPPFVGLTRSICEARRAHKDFIHLQVSHLRKVLSTARYSASLFKIFRLAKSAPAVVTRLTYGLSPVCARMWTFRRPLCVNTFRQDGT